jgi:hypothetical protein
MNEQPKGQTLRAISSGGVITSGRHRRCPKKSKLTGENPLKSDAAKDRLVLRISQVILAGRLN